MSDESLITAEMREQIGKESPTWTLEIDKTAVRMFARAVGYTDTVFYDEAEAKRRGFRSLPVPPGYLGTPVFLPRRAESEAAVPGMGGRASNPRLKRILNGGTEIEYLGDICAGDVLTATSKTAGLAERSASLGKMLITTTETSYRNQSGEVVAVMRGTLLSY